MQTKLSETIQKNPYVITILLATYPILYVFQANLGTISFTDTTRSFIVATSLAIASYFLSLFLTKKKITSAVISSYFVVSFFLVGSVRALFINQIPQPAELSIVEIRYWEILTKDIAGDLSLLLLNISFLFFVFLIIKKGKSRIFFQLLKWITLILFLISTLSFVWTYTLHKDTQITDTIGRYQASSDQPTWTLSKLPPDIYYIILDEYGRSDILQELFNYDNSTFIEELSRKGFHIANNSICNYYYTNLSLSSSLNMTYLDALAEDYLDEGLNSGPLHHMIQNNLVTKDLKQLGYELVTFDSGVNISRLDEQSDHYLHPPLSLNEFENTILNMTPLPLLRLPFAPIEELQYRLHYNRVKYTLENLPEIANLDQPTFTIAHVISPHPPFVFSSNGDFIYRKDYFNFKPGVTSLSLEEYKAGYIEQVAYLDKKVIEMVSDIITHSNTPPIIILQSDTGPYSTALSNGKNGWKELDLELSHERMAILNAIYLPENENFLYDEISPVNTFRLIFNKYFNTEYPLLPDTKYFSPNTDIYNFVEVP